MNQAHRLYEQTWVDHSPAQLKIKLCELMQDYQTHPSELLAVRVVEHIEALYQHYDCVIPTDQLCAWKKVLQHWRRLAWISH